MYLPQIPLMGLSFGEKNPSVSCSDISPPGECTKGEVHFKEKTFYFGS